MVGGVSNTTNTTNTTQTNYQTTQTDAKQGVQDTGAASASGVSGQQGVVPDPKAAAAQKLVGATMQLMQSMMALMPEISSEDQDAMLAEIETQMKQKLSQSNEESIKNKQNEKLTMLKEKAAQDEKAAKEMQDSIDKMKNASIWDKIKLAFEALGAIIACVVAVVAIATGVGAALGALLLASAVVALVMLTDSIVAEATPDHLGIAGSIRLATDHSDRSHADKVKDAKKADEIFGYTMMAVGFALAIAGGVAAFSSSISSAFEGVSEVASNVFSKLANSMGDISDAAQLAMKVGDVATGVVGLAGGGVGIGAAVINYEAAQDQADSLTDKAKATAMEALMKQIDDVIDAMIKALQGINDVFNAQMDAIVDKAKDRNKSLMHAFSV